MGKKRGWKVGKRGYEPDREKDRTVKKDGKTASTLHKVQNSPLKCKA